MHHPPEPSSTSPGPPLPDEPEMEKLLRQTLREEAGRATIPSDALGRLSARLDAARPLRRWFGPLRLAGAVAFALLILALVTPVGRLAAAGVHTATRTIITTVKQIASGDGSGSPPVRATVSAPNATRASASGTAATRGSGSPATGGTANPVATGTGTPTGTPIPIVGTPAGPASGTPSPPSPGTTATPEHLRPATATPTAAAEGREVHRDLPVR